MPSPGFAFGSSQDVSTGMSNRYPRPNGAINNLLSPVKPAAPVVSLISLSQEVATPWSLPFCLCIMNVSLEWQWKGGQVSRQLWKVHDLSLLLR